jgi:hypothetical protein
LFGDRFSLLLHLSSEDENSVRRLPVLSGRGYALGKIMTPVELLLLNLEEVRRRSLIIWRSIPPRRMEWRPSAEARSCIKIVRHVLRAEWTHTQILRRGKSLDSDASPFNSKLLLDINSELEFAEPYRREFLTLVGSYTPAQLVENKIDRSEAGYVRSVGDFVLRIAYHEAVHTGQLLSYLRMMETPIPKIWD